MTYPQQPSDPQSQQPQYQQPMYPPPATMQPASAAGTSIDFSALTRLENRPYLIAGVGGLVALLAYFILPFYSFSYHFGTISSSDSVTGSQIGGGSGWLYLTVLAALVALVVGGLMALNIRAISQLTPPLAARILLVCGIVGLIGLALYFLQAHNTSSDLGSLSSLGASAAGFSYGVGFGFYIAVLAMIAVLVGGIMQSRRPQMM